VRQKQKVFTKIQISYNAIGKYVTPCNVRLSDGTYARIFPRVFTKQHGEVYDKSAEYVTLENPQYQEVLEFVKEHSVSIASIDVFLGKKSSGGVAMIPRLCADLSEHVSRIFWIVCHHDREEKRFTLTNQGISCIENPMMYYIEDGKHPCREEYVFLGRLAWE